MFVWQGIGYIGADHALRLPGILTGTLRLGVLFSITWGRSQASKMVLTVLPILFSQFATPSGTYKAEKRLMDFFM
jgi:hypothetical protein